MSSLHVQHCMNESVHKGREAGPMPRREARNGSEPGEIRVELALRPRIGPQFTRRTKCRYWMAETAALFSIALTFDTSGGRQQAKPDVARPLDAALLRKLNKLTPCEGRLEE